MKVAFVVNDLQLSGGVGVVVEHARQLTRRHGFAVDLVLAREQDEPDWFRGLDDIPVHGMERARASRYDVAVATWWETVGSALELPAARHAYFIQSLEDRFYRPHDANRLAAALTHDLPLHVITEARWIAHTLEELTPARRCLLVRNGVAKDVFVPLAAPPVRAGEPLRILVEGNPDTWFKGVPEAIEATRAMRAPRRVTAITPDGRSLPGVDVPMTPVSQRELAGVYADHDVVLKLSRVEGMYGPPLEGFHRGATCVTTAVTGHDEYVVHGENGLVVDWDDIRGTSRALDLLATDRALLHRLRWGALATAKGWPSWEQQGTVMAAALREVARRPPPDGRAFDVRLLADVHGGIERHRAVVSERDRLRWRMGPIFAIERLLEHPRLRRFSRPARQAWGAARRRIQR